MAISRNDIDVLIKKYESQRDYFDSEMRKHSIGSLDHLCEFANRARCKDFILDLNKLKDNIPD